MALCDAVPQEAAWLTVKEAAIRLNLSRERVMQLVRTGQRERMHKRPTDQCRGLDAWKEGKHWRVDAAGVERRALRYVSNACAMCLQEGLAVRWDPLTSAKLCASCLAVPEQERVHAMHRMPRYYLSDEANALRVPDDPWDAILDRIPAYIRVHLLRAGLRHQSQIEAMWDYELMNVKGIGSTSMRQIRRVIPYRRNHDGTL
jgi:hypothetical protein